VISGVSLEIGRFLAARAGKKSRATYPDVAAAIGWGNANGRGLGNHLYDLLHYCKEQGLPALTTILVKKGERHPAPDAMPYIEAALGKINIDGAQQEVFAFNWPSRPEFASLPQHLSGIPDLWLTSFWGFDPENWGCIGFADENKRRFFLNRTRKGTLVAIYVTKNKGPEKMRGKVVGILEVSGRPVQAKERVSGYRWALKESDPESKGKWLFAVEVTRAWRIAEEDWQTVDDLLPAAYASAHPEHIGAQGVRVGPDEAAKLRSLTVYEVPVYGQAGAVDGTIQTFENALKPSKAVHPATEPYWVGETDGPKYLYILKLAGDVAAYLDRSNADLDDRMIVKVGFSRSPLSRCAQIQGAYPAGQFKWTVLKPDPLPSDPPYACADVAIAGEDAMKAKMVELKAESLGGEFFLTDSNGVQLAWGAGIAAADEASRKSSQIEITQQA